VGDIEADITPDIRSLAQQSTSSGVSTIARLEEAKKDAARQLEGFLGGRGLFRTGETGYQQGRQQTDYTRSRFDATQELLDYLAGYQAAFTQAEQQRTMSAQQAAQNALLNWLQMNPSAGGPAPSSGPAPASQAPVAPQPLPGGPKGMPPGSSLYLRPDGGYNVRDRNGKLVGTIDASGNFVPLGN
jgi:hypothetical protein